MVTISSNIPHADDLLALDVEELAEVLLFHLNSLKEGDSTVMQQGTISQDNFFSDYERRHKPQEYPDRQEEVDQALREAWAWLQSEGFLVKKSSSNGGLFISRRGQRITSREAFADYCMASLLPKRQLHPLIPGKVYPAFLRGDYDVAVFLAFREVEIAVRHAGVFPQELVGEKLIRAAFATAKNKKPAGPLTDAQLPVGEQEAMAHLFAGAFGLYRNSTGHRYVPTKPVEAAEVIMFASQLLRIVDRLKPQQTTGAQP